MKFRNRLRRFSAAAVSLVLLLSLTACGGKGSSGTSGQIDGPSGSGTNKDPGTADPTAAPVSSEFIYTPEFTELKVGEANYLNNAVYSAEEKRFLVTTYEKIGTSEIPEGEVQEYEGQYDIYGTKVYWLDLNGTATPVENFTQLDATEFLAEMEGYDGRSFDAANVWTNQVVLGPEGKIIAIDEVYLNWYTGPDDVELYSDEWYNLGYYNYNQWREFYILRVLNEDGTECGRINLTEAANIDVEAGDYFYPQNCVVGGDGHIYISTERGVMVFSEAGELVKTIETNWVESMLLLPSGRVGIAFYGDNGEEFTEIDPATLELDTATTRTVTNLYNAKPGIGDYLYIYQNGSNLMGYRADTGENEKILCWINCDINPNNVQNYAAVGDDSFAALSSSWNSKTEQYEMELALLKKTPATEAAKKTVLTLATQYLNYSMNDTLIRFNRTNPDYRIEVIDYSEYNTDEDYSAGLTKLTAELLAGNVPDILDLNELPYEQLAAKGLLLDLYPLIEADPELNGKLFDNVLELCAYNGKLCRTVSGFNVYTVFGAASVVGEKMGWTLQDFRRALATMPSGCEPFSYYTTREQILTTCLQLEMNRLVDRTTGECHFNTSAFTDVLNFAAEFPETFDWENHEWTEDDQDYNRIAAGRQMLLIEYAGDLWSWQYYQAVFGGQATPIGFPTSEGVGNGVYLNSDGSYAISARSAHADVAWQLIRQFFTEDFQTQYTYGFKTNRDAFNKDLEQQMTPNYMMNPDGSYVLDENGDKIEYTNTWYMGGTEVQIGALKQEEADQILALIESLDRVMSEDSELIQMVIDDSEAFFAGQKSAEEVGKLLQSKLTIYLSEQL